jgi:hypothetical protein
MTRRNKPKSDKAFCGALPDLYRAMHITAVQNQLDWIFRTETPETMRTEVIVQPIEVTLGCFLRAPS